MTDQVEREHKRGRALADFLRTRRARIAPEEVGFPRGGRRRTQGLRREEIAQLIGISPTWYTWLEQGRDIQVSDEVLESIVHVLHLNVDERSHFYHLAREQSVTNCPVENEAIAPVLLDVLEKFEPYPAHVRTGQWDVVAWNRSEKLFTDWDALACEERNVLWNHFVNPHVRAITVDWESDAQDLLAHFRMYTAAQRTEAWFIELFQRLQTMSPEFFQWWMAYEVRGTRMGPLELETPQVGRLFLERVALYTGDPEQLAIRVLMPVPNTGTAEKIQRFWNSQSEQ